MTSVSFCAVSDPVPYWRRSFSTALSEAQTCPLHHRSPSGRYLPLVRSPSRGHCHRSRPTSAGFLSFFGSELSPCYRKFSYSSAVDCRNLSVDRSSSSTSSDSSASRPSPSLTRPVSSPGARSSSGKCLSRRSRRQPTMSWAAAP